MSGVVRFSRSKNSDLYDQRCGWNANESLEIGAGAVVCCRFGGVKFGGFGS